MGYEPKRMRYTRQGVVPPLSADNPGLSPPSEWKSVDVIYREEAPAIRLFVKRMVRNTSDAEDIVQETFLRSWPALSSGNIACPRAFLFRAARNLALNHIRNGRVRNSDAAHAAADETFQRYIPTAEELLIASEEAAACRRLLDELPTRCREAFVLRVVDDQSYKQMSKAMRLSVSTVEKHIGKGKQICRALLSNPVIGDPSLEILVSRMSTPRQTTRHQAQRAQKIATK